MQSTSCDGVVLNVGVADLKTGRDAQESEPLGDLGILHEAAPDEGHFAVELRRQVDKHLNAVEARRERRHHELTLRCW